MLHYETVKSGTLELLKQLQQVPELAGTRLVGGTALALQFRGKTLKGKFRKLLMR